MGEIRDISIVPIIPPLWRVPSNLIFNSYSHLQLYFDIADKYNFYFVFHMPWNVWWHMNCLPANNLFLIVPSNPGKLSYIYLHLQAYSEEVDKYKSQYFIFHETTTPWDVSWPMNCACKSSKVNCDFKAQFFSHLIHFLAYLDVSNSYNFQLVFHISQDFSWLMNCVRNSPFVNFFFFESFLLHIYENLQAHLVFGRNRWI